jgi:hypothetical protein
MQMIERVTNTSMELDVPRKSTADTGVETMSSGLGLGLGNLFSQLKYWISVVSRTIEKLCQIVQERVKKVPAVEGSPLSVVT